MPPASVAVHTPVVAPGEDVVASVVAPALARIELAYVITHLVSKPSEQVRSSGTSLFELGTDLLVEMSGDTESAEHDVVVASERLEAGTHEVRLRAPDDEPPTVAGIVRWTARLLSGDGLDTPLAEAEVRVATDPVAGAATLGPDQGGDDELELVFPAGRGVRPGETLTGTLVITPGRSAKLSEVRVALRASRQDLVSGDDPLYRSSDAARAQISGPLEVGSGVRQELPFALELPADMPPSFATSKNRIDYELVAVADRRLRPDFETWYRVFVAS